MKSPLRLLTKLGILPLLAIFFHRLRFRADGYRESDLRKIDR